MCECVHTNDFCLHIPSDEKCKRVVGAGCWEARAPPLADVPADFVRIFVPAVVFFSSLLLNIHCLYQKSEGFLWRAETCLLICMDVIENPMSNWRAARPSLYVDIGKHQFFPNVYIL